MSCSNCKLPLEKAEKWATRILELLSPHCERIEIAGSIRRKKAVVSDIEVVCIPQREYDMFGASVGACAGFANVVNKWDADVGSVNGRYTRRILPNTGGFKVDIFMADKDNFGWIFALRTGSAVYVKKVLLEGIVAVNCRAEDGYIYDFTETLRPKMVSLPEEIDLYKLTGIEFIPPEERSLEDW